MVCLKSIVTSNCMPELGCSVFPLCNSYMLSALFELLVCWLCDEWLHSMPCLVVCAPQHSLQRAQGPCSWPCQGVLIENPVVQVDATDSISTLQEQPPAAPKELKASIKTTAVHPGSPATQQPAAAFTSNRSVTTANGPIRNSVPKQPPVGNKRTPAPTARGGAPVTDSPPKQQQLASATRATTSSTKKNTLSTTAAHKQQPVLAIRTHRVTAASPQEQQLAANSSSRGPHVQTAVPPFGPSQMQQRTSTKTSFPSAVKQVVVTSTPMQKQPLAPSNHGGLSAAKHGVTTSGCTQQQKKTAVVPAPQRPAAQGTKAGTGGRHSHSRPQPSAWTQPRPQAAPTARSPAGVMPPAARQTQHRSAVSVPGAKPTLPPAAARPPLPAAGAPHHLPSPGMRSAGARQQTSKASYAKAAATGVAPHAAQGCLISSKSPLDVLVEHYLTRKKDSKEQVAEDARIVNSLSEMAIGQHRIRSFRRIAGKLLTYCIFIEAHLLFFQ